jgi:hypothetical protein
MLLGDKGGLLVIDAYLLPVFIFLSKPALEEELKDLHARLPAH